MEILPAIPRLSRGRRVFPIKLLGPGRWVVEPEDAADLGGGCFPLLDGLEGAVPEADHPRCQGARFEGGEVGPGRIEVVCREARGVKPLGEDHPAVVARAEADRAADGDSCRGDGEAEA